MSTLTGTKIKDTYPGLIKIEDNGAVQPTVLKTLTDGTGGTLPLSVSQVETKFTSGSLVDFTGTTVTGLSFAAGLVSGVGTDSLKNADSLVTSAAIADGAGAISLGNGATANGAQSVSIGNGAQSTNNQGIAIGNFAESTSVGTAAIGEYASASGLYASAWGRTASAAADGSVAFGQQTNVPFNVPGGVALGRQVAADLADTTHVRALKIVAPDGGTGGNGITLLSPDGTAGEVTLTNGSELALDGTPIGGGGGGSKAAASGLQLAPAKGSFLSNTESFRTWVMTTGYGYSSTTPLSNSEAVWSYFAMNEGDTISKIYFNVRTAGGEGNAKVGIYECNIDTDGQTVIGNLLQDCGLVSATTTGDKYINLATPFTMPAGKEQGAVCIVIGGDNAATFAIATWSQGVWDGNGGRSTSNTFYRAMGLYLDSWDGTHKDYENGSYSSQTSGPVAIAIQ